MANILHRRRVFVLAAESWDSSIYAIYPVPPLPVVVNFVIEKHICAASNENISSLGGVVIVFDYCISSIDIGVSRSRNCGVNRPGVRVAGGLANCAG